MRKKVLSILLFLALLSCFCCCFTVRAAADSDLYPVTLTGVNGGIAKVTISPDGQIAPGTIVTVSISIPNNESQYNHRFQSITVAGANGVLVPTTTVAEGQTYAFTMPSRPVTVTVKLEIHPLDVYIQYGSDGSPRLVHTYTQPDMEALAITEPRYYTGIDSMPSVVQGKGIGVLLNTLIRDLKQYDSGVSFSEGTTLKLSSADNYTASYTYDFLLGAERYYYPNFTSVSHISTDGAEVMEPMFTINSFQGRNLTRQELDTRAMDTATAYRFCYGLLPSNVTAKFDPENKFANVTVNRFAKWVQRIDIIMPAAAQSGSAAALADEPQSHVSSSNSTLKWGLIGSAIIIIGIIAIVFIRRKDIAKSNKLTSK